MDLDRDTVVWQWRQLQTMAEHAQLRALLKSSESPISVEEIAACVAEIGVVIGDPMWCGHAEVSKASLKRWHNVLFRLKECLK
jgi:hypothetical protein